MGDFNTIFAPGADQYNANFVWEAWLGYRRSWPADSPSDSFGKSAAHHIAESLLVRQLLHWEPIWGDDIMGIALPGTKQCLAWFDDTRWIVFAATTDKILEQGTEKRQDNNYALVDYKVVRAMIKHGTFWLLVPEAERWKFQEPKGPIL